MKPDILNLSGFFYYLLLGEIKGYLYCGKCTLHITNKEKAALFQVFTSRLITPGFYRREFHDRRKLLLMGKIVITFAAQECTWFYKVFVAKKKGKLQVCKQYSLLLVLLMFAWLPATYSQVLNNNLTTQNPLNPADSFMTDSNDVNKKWLDEQAQIYYTTLNSKVKRYADTGIHNFHHYQFVQPWWGRDLGNYASPTMNRMFTPYQVAGPQLGYYGWDAYRLKIDSLPLYNTTRPYSDFRYNLGSKAEQRAGILHTQNITPSWNVAAQFRNINSPGFFPLQRSTGNSGSLSSNYLSISKQYEAVLLITGNRYNNDENGGVVSINDLNDPENSNRELIAVNLPATSFGGRRSAVSNMLRDFDFYIQNSYAWGTKDTLYNEDSTNATVSFTPRFKLKHQLRMHSEKHVMTDVSPDSSRYEFIAPVSFTTSDTLRTQQHWFFVDNKFSINGFVGKQNNQLTAEAGYGIRYDQFWSEAAVVKNDVSFVSNYLFGTVMKEADTAGEWQYGANAQMYLTGQAAGNFELNALVGKSFARFGSARAGLQQTLSNAPYALTSFNSNFFTIDYTLDKTSITQLWAELNMDRFHLQAGVRNYLMGNYIYYDADSKVQQDANVFSLLQVYGRKQFVYHALSLDNEVVWQQPTINAPVNVPALMLRHMLSVETYLFRRALKIATGVEARYHTPYYAAGYNPYFNQFYYQDSVKVTNPVELAAYFNFKVKNLRVFIMGDQLQQLFIRRNVINFVNYPAQNALFRFGFSWVLIN